MKVREGDLEFDFTGAASLALHDVARPAGEGNKTWPGVDFRVDEGTRELWIEVKSYARKAQADRIAADRDLPKVLASEEFRVWIVDKFLGTTAYLAWTGTLALKPIVYVVLIDSPHRDRTALLGTFSQRLRASFPKTAPWTHPIVHLVMDVETFKTRFYPCERV